MPFVNDKATKTIIYTPEMDFVNDISYNHYISDTETDSDCEDLPELIPDNDTHESIDKGVPELIKDDYKINDNTNYDDMPELVDVNNLDININRWDIINVQCYNNQNMGNNNVVVNNENIQSMTELLQNIFKPNEN